jgi:peptidyl-prolyl cis-trans isomerase A (cyclophilin A)
MKKALLVFSLLVTMTGTAQKKINCVVRTSLGDIGIELYPRNAPITVANFLRYVDAHLYDSSSFFRAVTLQNQPDKKIKIEVIQGGNVDSTRVFAAIPLETTTLTRLRHKDGTVSMARGGPNTATSSFFICINDQPSLDLGGLRNADGQGFAAFGKVTRGMDIVKKIQQLHPGQGQYFKPVVRIISIRRS